MPATVEDVLTRFDAADRAAGLRTLELIGGGQVLRVLVEQLLADVSGSGSWDLPPRLLAVAPVDHLERLTGSQLVRRPSRPAHGRTGRHGEPHVAQLRPGRLDTLDGEGRPVIVALVEMAFESPHPYDALVGRQLPTWAGAAVLITEGWAHPLSEAASSVLAPGADTPRRADGAYEVRLATAVARDGVQVSAAVVRGCAPQLLEDPGSAARALKLGGRVPAALARSLGVPLDPLDRRAWLLLGGSWARAVGGGWSAAVAAVGGRRAASQALQVRPDVLLAGGAAPEQFQRLCAERGVSAQDPDALVGLLRQGTLPADLLPATLAASLTGRDRDPAWFEAVDERLQATLSAAGWDEVLEATFALGAGLGEAPVPDGLLDWFDVTSAMYHCGLTIDASEAAAALRQVAGLPGAPRWFRASVRRFREHVEQLRLDLPAGTDG